MKPITIPADNTKITIASKSHKDRIRLEGTCQESSMRVNLSPDNVPHSEKGPNGGPLVFIKEFTLFNHQKNIVSAHSLQRAGIIKILKTGLFETRKGVKLSSGLQDYVRAEIRAEIIHPDLQDTEIAEVTAQY